MKNSQGKEIAVNWDSLILEAKKEREAVLLLFKREYTELGKISNCYDDLFWAFLDNVNNDDLDYSQTFKCKRKDWTYHFLKAKNFYKQLKKIDDFLQRVTT